MTLTPDFVFHLTAYNYDGKRAMNVALFVDVIWAILRLVTFSVIDGGTTYCELQKKVQFYSFSITKCA